ncbi:MAG: glycerophosphoryl diester phosphodiesterase membrane domain-containing protein [Planktothrix sp.]
MAKNQTLGSLSIVGIISAGLRIYRDHFKSYFNIALQAYCWSIVPIYGWAKLFALSALIGRLAYYETLEQPEVISQARTSVERKMWSFLGQGILVSLILIGGLLGLILVGGIALAILVYLLGQNNPLTYLIGFGIFIAVLFAYIGLASRMYIATLPLAVEDNMTATAAISRSWKLTKGAVLRIQGIMFLGLLIILPGLILVGLIMVFLQLALGIIVSPDSSAYNLIGNLFSVAVNIIFGALLLPFWQSIAGVLYYDLRVRREGQSLKTKRIKDRKSGV